MEWTLFYQVIWKRNNSCMKLLATRSVDYHELPNNDFLKESFCVFPVLFYGTSSTINKVPQFQLTAKLYLDPHFWGYVFLRNILCEIPISVSTFMCHTCRSRWEKKKKLSPLLGLLIHEEV